MFRRIFKEKKFDIKKIAPEVIKYNKLMCVIKT